ncbi:metallophosphoesterase [Oenococcus alcoholitolerans]|uniref:metallophosphoesterase n=1 Tax=Oenococcus alcoholitolerans TaxID=931074 RepID=UPI003F6F436B
MKYLIVSDNHGDREILKRIFSKFSSDKAIAAIFHNGDSLFDNNDPILKNINAVAGNNDYFSDLPDHRLYENKRDGLRIFQVHGHLQRVDFGLGFLEKAAALNHADVAIFGHTHRPLAEKHGSILFINPGSTTYPRGSFRKMGGTFAVLDVDKNDFKVVFFDRELQAMPNMTFVFPR